MDPISDFLWKENYMELLSLLGAEKYMHSKTRDLLESWLKKQGFSSKGVAFSTMTTDKAIEKALEIAKPSLQSILASTTLPAWSPLLEKFVRAVNDRHADAASLKTSLGLSKDQVLVLCTDPTWRQRSNFGTRISGPAFPLREVRKDATVFSLDAINSSGLLKWENLLVNHNEPAWLSLCYVPMLQIPVILKANKVTIGAQNEKVQVFEHGVEGADTVDAAILPCGAVSIQVSRRNSFTGSFIDSKIFLFRVGSENIMTEVSLGEVEQEEAEQFDAARFAATKLDFRDHGSVLSLITTSDGSRVCLQDKLIYETSEILVAALGCPQSWFAVFANGLVKKMSDAEVLESRNFPAIYSALLT